MSEREALWTFLRRGRRAGNAHGLLDPLGWRVHRSSWPIVWLARKFRAGSWPNRVLYATSDWWIWHRAVRRFGKDIRG